MRTKKKVITNVTLQQAQAAAKTIAINTNKLKSREEKLDKAIAGFEKYQLQILRQNEKPLNVLEAFGMEQKANWGKRKSLELKFATIGFRTGVDKIQIPENKDWAEIVTLMKKNPAFARLIRITEEVNKQAIINEKSDELLALLQKYCHIQVVKEEGFFVKPNTTINAGQ